jgi:hypothetical protein
MRTGGGYGSAKHVEAKKGKAEPITHKGNPAGVAQQGMATAFKKEEIRGGPNTGYRPYGPKDHTMQGPGAGREIHRSGGQGLYSSSGKKMPMPSEPMPAGRDILSEYGRDIPGRTKR